MTAEEYLKTKVIKFESLNETLEFTVYSLIKLMEDYHQAELKKLRVGDVSVCTCGSTKYYSEQYKDVTKYYCSNCHQKLPSKY